MPRRTREDAIVWSIATKYIPPLMNQVEAILPPIPETDSESET